MVKNILHRVTYFSILCLIMSFVIPPLSTSNSVFTETWAQSSTSGNNTSTNSTAFPDPGGMTIEGLKDLASAIKQPESALEIKMAQLESSDKPEDIATLAYIWGYPLISMERSFNWFTNPVSGGGAAHGPANHLNCNKELLTSNDTDVVLPNADTLYCVSWMDLSKEPMVLKVPAIPDRYYTFEFLDAYTNVFDYVGTRATGSEGGTYLIASPEWHGEVPEGMIKIWSPTDLTWILQRTLLKGSDDISNVHALQDQMSVNPLSVYVSTNSTSTTPSSTANSSTTSESYTATNTSFVPADHIQNPVSPKPPFIPTTGIKIFDEIGTAMTGNSLNPPQPALVEKFASIGIGVGKTPSIQANDTIKAALKTAITEGERLISDQVPNLGSIDNGWRITSTGVYGTDYLFRAAVAKLGLGANIGQEAIYPPAFTDSQGMPLSGNNSYVIHFEPNQLPPVDGFWSVSMYGEDSYFVDNPINRYHVSPYNGIQNNTDGSLDLYIQNTNPGPDKESNWLPSPTDAFKLTMRLYLPGQPVLDGSWPLPSIERVS